jgi:hypothetical protein
MAKSVMVILHALSICLAVCTDFSAVFAFVDNPFILLADWNDCNASLAILQNLRTLLEGDVALQIELISLRDKLCKFGQNVLFH